MLRVIACDKRKWSRTKSKSSTNDLQEEIMDQLRAESAGVQVTVAFGILFEVLTYSMRNEPDETKLVAAQLNHLFNAMQ
jgi:hypothetical protein